MAEMMEGYEKNSAGKPGPRGRSVKPSKGLEEVLELKLSADEQSALNKSAQAVRELQTITGV